MKQSYVLLIFLLFLFKTSEGQTYMGTMGDSKIFLELASYDESHWEGYFFYGDSLKHIILEGYDADGHIFLSSTDDQSAVVQFNLENKADDLVGTFKTDEQNLQVTLTESKMDLDKYKMDHLNYVKDSTATSNLIQDRTGFYDCSKRIFKPKTRFNPCQLCRDSFTV